MAVGWSSMIVSVKAPAAAVTVLPSKSVAWIRELRLLKENVPSGEPFCGLSWSIGAESVKA